MHATLITTGVLTLMLVVLSGLVIAGRVTLRVALYDGGHEVMRQRIRTQANFVEYVPMALIVLTLVEWQRIGPSWLPAAMGATLVVARLWHAQGLLKRSGTSIGRFMGTNLTALVLVSGAIAVLGRGMGAW